MLARTLVGIALVTADPFQRWEKSLPGTLSKLIILEKRGSITLTRRSHRSPQRSDCRLDQRA